MKVSDNAIARLRAAVESPDLEGSRYYLLDKLGQGGMGGVYRVEDSILGRQVAMKVVTVPDSTSSLADRLVREAQIIARLEHPGIVPVHDVGTLPDGRVFYTMKLVQGKRPHPRARQLLGAANPQPAAFDPAWLIRHPVLLSPPPPIVLLYCLQGMCISISR
jgi:hypothetical protein